MKVKNWFGASALSLSLLIPSVAAYPAAPVKAAVTNKAEVDLPNVTILATGGTIAGSSASNTDTTNYDAGKLGIETLIKAVPEMTKVADVSGEQVANVGSTQINNEILLKLGKRINSLLASDDVDGIVVTHGTDTLEETAYFLNLVVKSTKPVVLVGAMRPATAISADGPLNLYNAVKLAANPAAKKKGVMISFNDRIGAARYVTKTHTTAVDTFKSVEQGYLGGFAGESAYFSSVLNKKHTTQTAFDISKIEKLPQVDILYSYQNDGSYLYDAAVEAGAQGIVVAGSGNGSMSQNALAGAKSAVASGVSVVRSTRVGSGVVTHKPLDDTEGFVSADSLNPQKARILLMLTLTRTHDPKKIQQYFDKY